MPRIAAISLARLSLKNIPKKRILQVINIIIFVSFFAVTASIISLVYERKIDQLDKIISTEQTNEIIYNYWLSTTLRKITNIENILDRNFTTENYLFFIKAFDDRLITERDLGHNVVMDYISYCRSSKATLLESLRDALIISSSKNDLKEIEKFHVKKNTLTKRFKELEQQHSSWMLTVQSKYLEQYEKKLEEEYKNILILKDDYIELLNNYKDTFIDFNLNFYSKKKDESELKVIKTKEKINTYATNEANSILFAFLIQLIIFFVIQYFEFAFELVTHVKRKMK